MNSNRISSNRDDRFSRRENDANLLFGQLSRPLESNVIRDGFAALTDRMSSQAFLRTMSRHY